MTKIVYDTHIHSEFSTDSNTPVRDQLNRAVQLGLKGVCLTDHMDYDFPEDQTGADSALTGPAFVFDTTDYHRELTKLQSEFSNLEIGIGVECGLQTLPSVLEKNDSLIRNHKWDYVIGSLHLVDRTDPYYPSYWEGKNAARCVLHYFEELFDNLKQFHNIDSLGHLDYIVRYAPSDFRYCPNDYADIVEEILSFLIRKDIALEINSSGLKSTSMPNPHFDILNRYAARGGELVTIGSDAHTPDYMGYRFDSIAALMQKAGLRQYVTYHQHKPVFHSL